jgi:hypothetical protein
MCESRALTLQKRVLCHQRTASHAKVEKETLWKNNRSFVKDIPMVYVNFIITVIMVSEKIK